MCSIGRLEGQIEFIGNTPKDIAVGSLLDLCCVEVLLRDREVRASRISNNSHTQPIGVFAENCFEGLAILLALSINAVAIVVSHFVLGFFAT